MNLPREDHLGAEPTSEIDNPYSSIDLTKECDLTEEPAPTNHAYGMAWITPVSIALSRPAFRSCTSENRLHCTTLDSSLSWVLASCLLSFRSFLSSLIRGGQGIRVMGLSLRYNMVEELQVKLRFAERYTLDVERSIWLKT